MRWQTACFIVYAVVWRSGSELVSINEVNLRRTRLVLRLVTVSRFNSPCLTFISVCNQPPRPTQPYIPPGSVNEDHLRLGRQKQVWFIPLADERGENCEIHWERAPYLSALEVCSRRGAQSTFTLPCLTCALYTCICRILAHGYKERRLNARSTSHFTNR